MLNKISIDEKFSDIKDMWAPKTIGEIDNYHVKLVKMKGCFDMHHHNEEDEMFLVIKGNLKIKTEEKDIKLSKGELVVIPAGADHKPIAEEECKVMLFERKSIERKGD